MDINEVIRSMLKAHISKANKERLSSRGDKNKDDRYSMPGAPVVSIPHVRLPPPVNNNNNNKGKRRRKKNKRRKFAKRQHQQQQQHSFKAAQRQQEQQQPDHYDYYYNNPVFQPGADFSGSYEYDDEDSFYNDQLNDFGQQILPLATTTLTTTTTFRTTTNTDDDIFPPLSQQFPLSAPSSSSSPSSYINRLQNQQRLQYLKEHQHHHQHLHDHGVSKLHQLVNGVHHHHHHQPHHDSHFNPHHLHPIKPLGGIANKDDYPYKRPVLDEAHLHVDHHHHPHHHKDDPYPYKRPVLDESHLHADHHHHHKDDSYPYKRPVLDESHLHQQHHHHVHKHDDPYPYKRPLLDESHPHNHNPSVRPFGNDKHDHHKKPLVDIHQHSTPRPTLVHHHQPTQRPFGDLGHQHSTPSVKPYVDDIHSHERQPQHRPLPQESVVSSHKPFHEHTTVHPVTRPLPKPHPLVGHHNHHHVGTHVVGDSVHVTNHGSPKPHTLRPSQLHHISSSTTLRPPPPQLHHTTLAAPHNDLRGHFHTAPFHGGDEPPKLHNVNVDVHHPPELHHLHQDNPHYYKTPPVIVAPYPETAPRPVVNPAGLLIKSQTSQTKNPPNKMGYETTPTSTTNDDVSQINRLFPVTPSPVNNIKRIPTETTIRPGLTWLPDRKKHAKDPLEIADQFTQVAGAAVQGGIGTNVLEVIQVLDSFIGILNETRVTSSQQQQQQQQQNQQPNPIVPDFIEGIIHTR